METHSIDLPRELVVVGLAARTSPETAARDIPAVWQRFMQELGGSRIQTEPVYAVYCDYQSDHRGAYTFVLGFAEDTPSTVGPGLRSVTIPPGKLARFAAHGAPAQVIWQTWSQINTAWDRSQERSYLVDYERYAPGGTADRVDAEIFVGLR